MATVCAFCGKNEVSKEHLFAKWIREEYPAYHSKENPSTISLEKDGSEVWSYKGKTLEQGVNDFCRTCNNGWMNRLETKAGAIMKPMVKAKRVGIKLGYSAQHDIASWTVKTAMVLNCLHPSDNFIPQSDYREFYRKQQPSSNVFILLGARHIAGNSKGANMFEYKTQFIGRRDRGIQHIHFAFGALYFGIAMFIGTSRRFPRTINEEAAMRAHLIWPVQLGVIWPSASISDIGGVDGMFNAFSQAAWRV